MALSPLYGKIAWIGNYGENYKEVEIDDEVKMIINFFERIENDRIVTWNGKGFDFDFIIKRGVVLGVCPLSLLEVYTNKYKSEYHIDLMEKWCGYGKFAKLNEIASILLDGECKDDLDVKQIPELMKTTTGKEMIRRYCLQDCKLTYELARKMGY